MQQPESVQTAYLPGGAAGLAFGFSRPASRADSFGLCQARYVLPGDLIARQFFVHDSDQFRLERRLAVGQRVKREKAVGPHPEEACVVQNLEIAGSAGLGDVKCLHDLTNAAFFDGQNVDDTQTRCV